MRLKEIARQFLRHTGFELVPYPPRDWVRNRNTLRDVLDRLSINCVLDVGANRGQYGNFLRNIGYTGWIVSFEPVHSVFDILAQSAAQRGPWRVFQYALGASEQSLEINVTRSEDFSSFLTPRQDSRTCFPGNCVERKETVDVRRLDDILENAIAGIPSPRLYLKLDTQGFDLEVIKGAERVLPGIHGLQTEVSFQPIYHDMTGFTESIAAFRAYGFDILDFMPVTRGADGLSAIEMDCVMTRKPE